MNPPGRQTVLVSTAWLSERLAQGAGDPALAVVDIRGQVLPPGTTPRYRAKRADYDAGHIPGAVFIDWTRDIVDVDDPIPSQIAAPDAFAAKMSELGIGDDTTVVAYDDYDHIFAGRLAWALRYYGHEAVRILDGGWSRWVAEGLPQSRDVSRPTPRAFTARPRFDLRKNADEVAELLGRRDVLLVDARPADQFAGRTSAATRAGHIPGARNVPYASLIDPKTSQFLPEPELAQVFARAGIDLTQMPPEVVVYCNGGISCTVPLEAFRLLGRDDIAVYDGSWNEWGNDPTRPIEGGGDASR